MAIKLVTSFQELLRLARAEAEARKSGDPVALAEAVAAHNAYKELCLRADSMSLGVTQGALQ